MKCTYCGKDINENDKYCQFCGAPVKKVAAEEPEKATNPDTGRVGQPVEKKPANAKKIILIVVGVVVGLHLLVWLGIFAFFATLGVTPSNFNEKLGELDQYIEEFNDIMDENYNDEDFDFDFDDEDFDFFNETPSTTKPSKNEETSSSFKSGVVDQKKNSYTCKMADIKFTLPEEFKIYNEKEIDELYEKTNVSDSMRKKNALVYDFYAKNALGTKIVYVDFVNKEYYSEYKDIKGYIKHIKETYTDYEQSGYKLEMADDSRFYPYGKDAKDKMSFYQIASRVTDKNGSVSYDYSLISECDDYYILITMVSTDLYDIGNIMDGISGK